MSKLTTNKELCFAFKDALLGHLTMHLFYCWIRETNYEIYTEESVLNRCLTSSWDSLYPLLSIAFNGERNSSYLEHRDKLLDACKKFFHKREDLTKDDIVLLEDFYNWLQKSDVSFRQFSQRLHVSNCIYGIKARDIWKDEYHWKNALMQESFELPVHR